MWQKFDCDFLLSQNSVTCSIVQIIPCTKGVTAELQKGQGKLVGCIVLYYIICLAQLLLITKYYCNATTMGWKRNEL